MRGGRNFLLALPIVAGLALVLSSPSRAQPPPSTGEEGGRRIYVTHRIEGTSPLLDGRPDEPAWDAVPWSGGFTQRDPVEGVAPSCSTAFKILYDEHALYVAYRAWDPEPSRVEHMLARRDWFPGDWVEINIDSRRDGRTAFSFTASASGVRGDEYVSEDGNDWDSSWDPVWTNTTAVDDHGWTAEIRIPFSQLRYSPAGEQAWGIQVQRRLFRKEERSVWQFISRDDEGWVSRFGELRGLRELPLQRQLEVAPYFVGDLERSEKISGDPFADGTDQHLDSGVDAKLGIGSGLILDASINPDFGQVEADPAEVNLTAFETFFGEKRLFFIEGSDIFRYEVANAITGGNFTQDRLFYSRRVGREPQGSPSLEDGEFASVPNSTSILGAAKLSGKTARGLSVGVLDAVTARERASIDGFQGGRGQVVEPATNYFVGRVQKDLRDGQTQIGGMLTSTHRDVSPQEVRFLHSAAYVGGLDLEHRFHDRAYSVLFKILASSVRGEKEALVRTQTSSAHYFQRPDAHHVSVDSTATSLSGHAGSIYAGKQNGRWRFQGGLAWRSPGFELNDLGYMRTADEINHSTWAGYYLNQPFGIFHRMEVNANEWLYWDFGGNNLLRQSNVNTHATLRNRWEYYAGITRTLEARSNSALRGGPSMLLPGSWSIESNVSSDARLPVHGAIAGSIEAGDEGGDFGGSAEIELDWRVANGVQLSANPEWSHSWSDLQYIGQADAGGADRFLFGRIRQKTAVFTVRVDACLSPNLTVQYYAQPFVSAGRYGSFKRITNPDAGRYADRFHVFDPAANEIAFDADADRYVVDEDRDGTADYSFSDPDFNYKEFHSNLVLRWEYEAGSTLYLVWSQGRAGSTPSGGFSLRDDVEDLFDIHPRNIFLIKISKWFAW
ncbi:MAG: DUF5916 domain-containing protein [Candidatus Eisenbacteria bacterium]|nr:DUF5916 domain-containing protein [Candidatus Eisenbacteria bacterium]